MMSRMSFLTTRLTSTRGLDHRLGGTRGLAEGGIEELDEFWLSRCWRSRTRASSSANRSRSRAHWGQAGVGDDEESLMPRDNTDCPKSGKSD